MDDAVFYIQSLDIERQKYLLKRGEQFDLAVSRTPLSASNRPIAWYVQNPNILDVENGMIHTYNCGTTLVAAICDYGKAFCEIEVSEETQILDTPELGTLKMVKDGISGSWNSVEGADYYLVYRVNQNEKRRLVCKVNLCDKLEFLDKNVISGREYGYYVEACAESGAFNRENKTKKIVYLAAPVITEFQNFHEGVLIRWNNVEGAEKYQVFRKEESNKWGLLKNCRVSKKMIFEDKDVASGVHYKYALRACSQDVFGCWDEKKMEIKYLEEPQMVSAEIKDGITTVVWNPIVGAEGYNVYRRYSTNNRWRLVAHLEGLDTVFQEERSEIALYVVRAFSGDIMSQYNKDGIRSREITLRRE